MHDTEENKHRIHIDNLLNYRQPHQRISLKEEKTRIVV